MVRALFICEAFTALNLSLSYQALPGLRGNACLIARRAFLKAYSTDPTSEHACLVMLSHWGALLQWEAIYPEAALPSEVFFQLETGLKKKKRYLGLWVTSWLKKKKQTLTLYQQAEAVAAWLYEDESTYQTPSDTSLRAAILQALSALTKKDREIIVWLSEDRSSQEIAALRGLQQDTAKRQIQRAREAFNAKLPKDYQKKKK